MRSLLNPFRRGRSLGLDVGSKSVKWVWLDVEKKQVLESGCVDLMPGSGSLDPSLLEQNLSAALQALPGEANGANTAVQGPQTAYGYLEIPELPDDELRIAVQAEAQQWIPFSLENTEFRYQKMPPAQPGPTIGAFYAAAVRPPVERLRHLLSRLGRPALRVEVPALALAREHRHNHPDLAQEYCGLLHFGYSCMHLVICRGGFPYYAREFVPGASEFIEALQTELGSDWSEAEEVYCAADFRMPALGPPLSRLTEALRRTLRHCGAADAPFFLSGGGATGNLSEVLRARLGIQLTMDGWDRIAGDARPALFKLAVGLALP
jgi:Tfp pilus assembly PilM family ATPase